MMQTSAALKTIKKKLVRKVLDLIKKWSDDELKCRKAKAGEEGECIVRVSVCVPACTCAYVYTSTPTQHPYPPKVSTLTCPALLSV
jgi:hypothetical protein